MVQGHGHLDDRMISGVRHIRRRVFLVELDAVRAKRRDQNHPWFGLRRERLRVDEHRRCPAIGAGLPDDALKRIRHIDIARIVEGERVEPGVRSEPGAHEYARLARDGIGLPDDAPGKIADQATSLTMPETPGPEDEGWAVGSVPYSPERHRGAAPRSA